MNTGAPVPHTFSNVGGVLTFGINPIIPADTQIAIDITVVLDDSADERAGQDVHEHREMVVWSSGRCERGRRHRPE